MVDPVAHGRHAVRHAVTQRTRHELAERDVGRIVVMSVADDEIHRHIQRPVHIGFKAEIRRQETFGDSGAIVVGVGPDVAAPGQKPVRLAVGEGRGRKQGRRQRLQFEADLHLAPHVRFGVEIEIDLDRAGPQHHVAPLGANLGHVVFHDPVARFGHPRRFVEPPFRAAAHAEKADSQGLGHFAQLCQMRV